jgi:MFS family permease
MLSQAAIFGLRADLQLTVGVRYSFSSAIFYLGFIVGATPAIIMAQRYPIERVAFAIVAVWGACLMCTAACHNYQGLYAQRFFLGLLESGVSPMFMLIVAGFYKKDEQALRMGAWYCATGYVSIFAPLSMLYHLIVRCDYANTLRSQLWARSYSWRTRAVEVHVLGRRFHHDHLVGGHLVLHASRPHPHERSY